jgi:hypothetical protein
VHRSKEVPHETATTRPEIIVYADHAHPRSADPAARQRPDARGNDAAGLRGALHFGGQWATDEMYVVGYRDAAEILIQHAQENGGQDALFYPVCFLYRHAIELTLKNLIAGAMQLAEVLVRLRDPEEIKATELKSFAKPVLGGHNLGDLLDVMTKVLAALTDQEIPEKVATTIIQLDEVDSTGQTFRYSTNRQRVRWLKNEEHVDFVRLHEDLDGAVSCLFFGVGSWLDQQIEWATEMEAARDV